MVDDPSASPREIELKLVFEPGDLDRVRAALLDGARARPRQRALAATYFDTPNGALREAGLSLRIRAEGRRRIQTLKAQDGAPGLVMDRGEWESPVRDGLDLDALAGTPLAAMLADGLAPEDLRPVFETRVERTILKRRQGASTVELVLDAGEVAAGERAQPFGEIEIELKAGEPHDLFAGAAALAEAAPVRLGLATKASRGYALLAEEAPAAVKAEPIALERGLPSARAFQAVARSCLRQFVQNEAVLRQRRESSAVHQARVGLRRLRAAFTLFKALIADEESAALKEDLRWMGNQLGPARDLDVFIARHCAPGGPGESQRAAYERRRDEAYATAEAALASPRLRRATIAVAGWIEAGSWLNRPETKGFRKTPIEEHAAVVLARLRKKIRKRGRHLRALDPEARHEVRIEIKKLRYATEFFGGLFVGGGAKKRRRAALEALETLQETLGELNDLAVASLMTAPMAGDGAPEAAAPIEDPTEGLLDEAERAYRAFARTEPFWR